MNTKNLILIALFVSVSVLHGIENLQISIAGSNAFLSWPSLANESFIVQYRPTLTTNDPWVSLSTNFPAATGTNWTTFVHSNSVTYPDCPTSTNGGGSFGGPPGPNSMMAVQTEQGTLFVTQDGDVLTEQDLLPYPWNPLYAPQPKLASRKSTTVQSLQGGGGAESNAAENDESFCPPTIGFYRVVRIGVRFFGITNGTVLRGRVALPIEVGFNQTPIESVFASGGTNVDENLPIPGFSIDGLDTGFLQATWDTTRATNGAYQVFLGAQVATRISNAPPITLLVSNDIWFPDAFNVAGYFIEVQAQSIHTNGTYQVDIYNDGNTNIITVTGTNDAQGYITYAGVRGFRVQNYDSQTGIQKPSKFYNVVVATTAAGQNFGGTTAINTNFIWVEQPWPSNTFQNLYTAYTIGYQPIFGNPAGGGLNAVALQTMVQAWYSAAEARESGFDVVGGSSQNPFEMYNQQDFTTLLLNLRVEEVRNLFFFGHGSPEYIGQKKATPPLFLSVQDFFTGLHNFPQVPGVLGHPFRFVFLDGCNTAKGDLCKAFGIPKQKNMPNTAFFNKGLRYRAFCGWDTYIIIAWGGAPSNAHLTFMAQLLDTWPHINQGVNPPRPYTLREAVNVAKTGYASTVDSHLIIYGYEGLWFDDTIP